MKKIFKSGDRVATMNGPLKIGTIKKFCKQLGIDEKFNTYWVLYDYGIIGITRESGLILLSDLSNPLTKLTSRKWMRFISTSSKLEIIDPDGWDRNNFKFSFDKELITKDEFMKRLCFSTIQCNLKELNMINIK